MRALKTIIAGLHVVMLGMFSLTTTSSVAQNAAPAVHFIDYQRSIPKVRRYAQA
jgi:hypothetical protein